MKKTLYCTLLFFCVLGCSSKGKHNSKNGYREKSISRDQLVAQANETKYNKLSLALRSGQDDEVEAAATALLKNDAKDVIALNALAMHHFRRGRIGLSRVLLKQAAEIQPNSSTLQNNLGLIALEEKNHTVAISAFQEALAMDDKNFAAAGNLGSLYAGWGDCEKATPQLERAYDNDHRTIDVQTNLAVCYGQLGRVEAEGMFRKVLVQEPRHPRVLLSAAEYWMYRRNSVKEAAPLVKRMRSQTVPKELLPRLTELESQINRSGINGG